MDVWIVSEDIDWGNDVVRGVVGRFEDIPLIVKGHWVIDRLDPDCAERPTNPEFTARRWKISTRT